MLVVEQGGFCIPQRFPSRDTAGDDLARFKEPIHEVTANIQSGSISLQLSKQSIAIFDVVALMPINQRHYLRSELKKIVPKLTLCK